MELTTFKSLPQLLNHFQEEATCIRFLEQQRWKGNEPTCPHCGHNHVYRTNRGYKCANKECYKKFSVTVGTVFENSKIKLSLWFAAIYLCTAHKKGISSLQLSRDLGITQKTAWFMLHRIRETLRKKNSPLLQGKVEMDETFVGGKNRNRHKDKKIANSQGRSFKDKTPVFGMIESVDGMNTVNTMVIPNTQAETLQPIIKDLVLQGTILVTDDWGGYAGLDSDYQHHVVKHMEGKYVEGNFTTNSIEGFWSLFKRGIFGIYHYASRKHLSRYCDEFEYRFNTRKIKDTDRFQLSLGRVEGKLTYKDLVYGKDLQDDVVTISI